MSVNRLKPTTKPELKIVFYLFFVVSLFTFANLTAYLCASAVLGLFFLKIPWKKVKSGWLPISIFLFFTFVSNAVGRPGRVVFSSALFMMTDEGAHIAMVRTMRVFLMIGGAKVLMAGARAEDMVDGLGRLFGPLERVGIPVKDFFHTMGLTMKCLPLLKTMATETYRERVKTSDTRGFRAKVTLLSAFLLPIFVRSLQSPESFFKNQRPPGPAGGENTAGR
jgi:energy-coupling factor transport system permease protein